VAFHGGFNMGQSLNKLRLVILSINTTLNNPFKNFAFNNFITPPRFCLLTSSVVPATRSHGS